MIPIEQFCQQYHTHCSSGIDTSTQLPVKTFNMENERSKRTHFRRKPIARRGCKLG